MSYSYVYLDMSTIIYRNEDNIYIESIFKSAGDFMSMLQRYALAVFTILLIVPCISGCISGDDPADEFSALQVIEGEMLQLLREKNG